MMYKCFKCGKEFDEPKKLHETYEHYYGCTDLESRTPFWLYVCPRCNSEDFEEVKEMDEEDED